MVPEVAGRRLLHILTEAPTPHNNYFFSVLAQNPALSLELNYIYSADKVPGRPWKSLSEGISGVTTVRAGLGSWFDLKLFLQALESKQGVFFVIGWNHPLLYLIIVLLGMRRAPLLMWFDTPNPEESSPAWHPKYLLKRFVVKMINRTSGTIFVTGSLAGKQMQSIGINAEKISMLPFFIPTEGQEISNSQLTRLEAEYQLPRDAIVFLAAGRMIQSKGFDILLDALAELEKGCHGEWVMLIVGSGPESEALLRQASELGIERRLRFVSWVEPDTLYELISMADVFVAPARFDPFPTTVISAMNFGKAIVATNGVGSAMEFIAHGESGLIVESGEVAALASALGSLFFSAELRKKIGDEAKRSIQQWPVERGVEKIKFALDALHGY